MPNSDPNPEVVGNAVPMHMQHRPAVVVPREMVCFIAGIGLTLGILWLVTNFKEKK